MNVSGNPSVDSFIQKMKPFSSEKVDPKSKDKLIIHRSAPADHGDFRPFICVYPASCGNEFATNSRLRIFT
jgi:hypothetical protein